MLFVTAISTRLSEILISDMYHLYNTHIVFVMCNVLTVCFKWDLIKLKQVYSVSTIAIPWVGWEKLNVHFEFLNCSFVGCTWRNANNKPFISFNFNVDPQSLMARQFVMCNSLFWHFVAMSICLRNTVLKGITMKLMIIYWRDCKIELDYPDLIK